MRKRRFLNPGSIEAVSQGCTCPMMDNRCGKGGINLPKDDFRISQGCPLHDPEGKTGTKKTPEQEIADVILHTIPQVHTGLIRELTKRIAKYLRDKGYFPDSTSRRQR